MRTDRSTRWFRIVAAALIAASAAGILPGSGTVPCEGADRFPGTRLAPDLLIALKRGGSMSSPAGDAVSDLDGNGIRSRYDLALSVLFRLLNADGNRIDGLASPRNASDVPRFRKLIDIEDELHLHSRIVVLPYGDGIPPHPPKRPPFGGWNYRAVWDGSYAPGTSRFPSMPGSPAPFPAAEIGSYFTRNDSAPDADPFSSCRPRVVIIISDGSDFPGPEAVALLPDGIDRVFVLFVAVNGGPERARLLRIFGGSTGTFPGSGRPEGRDVRVAFFDTPEEVDASYVFDEIALPFDRGPWMAGPPAVPALRTADSGFLFAASLSAGSGRHPVFGTGTLRNLLLGPDGSFSGPGNRGRNDGSVPWAGIPEGRTIYTSVDGGKIHDPNDPSDGVATSRSEISRASVTGGIADRIRRIPLGAFSGNTPVLVGPPSPYYADSENPETRRAFAALHSRRKRVLLAASNEGMLHAFDAGSWDPRGEPASYGQGTGIEEWAYLPGYLLDERRTRFPASPADEGFADGSTVVADIVVDPAYGPAVPLRETGWRTYAIGGAGTGGRGYFALDITDSRSPDYPAPKWELSKAELPLLGLAWSTPAIGKIRQPSSGEPGGNRTRGRWVAVVGAGKGTRSGATTLRETVDLRGGDEDPGVVRVEDTGNAPESGRITLSVSRTVRRKGNWVTVRYRATGSYSSKDRGAFRGVVFRNRPDRLEYAPAGTLVSWTDPGDEGRALLVLDASTGQVLQTLTHPAMGEVVAPPAVLTDDQGYIARIYVGDLDGNVWRATPDSQGVFTLGGMPFFTVSGDGYSNAIYAKVAVAEESDGRKGAWIFFGTGDRENPMDGSRGAVFAVYDDLTPAASDRGGPATLTERNLSNASAFFARIEEPAASLPSQGNGALGWYGVLPGIFEKMISVPRVFQHNLYFSTFEPESGTCPPGGTGRVYGFGIGPGRTMGDPALLDDLRPDRSEPGRKAGRVRSFPSSGILSGPAVSIGTDGAATLYAGSADGAVFGCRIPSPGRKKSIRYWRDVSR